MKFRLEIDCANLPDLGALAMVIRDCAHRSINPPDTVSTPIHADRMTLYYNGQPIGSSEVVDESPAQDAKPSPKRVHYRIMPEAEDMTPTEIDADEANDLHRSWCQWQLTEERSNAELAAWEEVLQEAAKLIDCEPDEVADVEQFEK